MDVIGIQGVLLEELIRHEDERGWLAEMYREDELSDELFPVMSYLSVTRPGMTRGPHEHRYQTDIFTFLGLSRFRIILWDNREKSPTYGKKIELETSENKTVRIVVPPGVVHAYTNIGTAEGITVNSPNHLYKGRGRRGEVDEIRHENDTDSPFSI